MQETITPIALDDLHESPFNPRKTFTDITELADTIKAEGRIHSPLLVRPRLTNLSGASLDDVQEGYEIVFGHRRYRAAEQLGLATVPCMVRALTDAEARSAQIAENLARQDVHPIEEAEGFAALIEQDGITAEDLAARDVLARFRGARSMAKAAANAAGTSTPSTAGAGAKKATAARAKTTALGKGIRYRCAATGSTWSGKGLQPKWLKVALAQGKTLADFDLAAPKAQDQKVKVDAGSAGERCAHTGDLLEAAGA